MAETFADTQHPEKAIEEYEEAIRKDPKNPDLYEALGEENQRVGRVEPRQRHMNRISRCIPTAPSPCTTSA